MLRTGGMIVRRSLGRLLRNGGSGNDSYAQFWHFLEELGLVKHCTLYFLGGCMVMRFLRVQLFGLAFGHVA